MDTEIPLDFNMEIEAQKIGGESLGGIRRQHN